MDGAPADPVEGVCAGAVPGFEVKFPVAFPPRLIQSPEPASKLIPQYQHPPGVISKKLAQLLDSRILGDVPALRDRLTLKLG
jgi:hypothetical protein